MANQPTAGAFVLEKQSGITSQNYGAKETKSIHSHPSDMHSEKHPAAFMAWLLPSRNFKSCWQFKEHQKTGEKHFCFFSGRDT